MIGVCYGVCHRISDISFIDDEGEGFHHLLIHPYLVQDLSRFRDDYRCKYFSAN